MTAGDLEWEQRLDEASGVYYYYNSATQEATWTTPATYKPLAGAVQPEEAAVAAAADGEEFEWEQRLDPTHNVHYYLNVKTQEASWEQPEKFRPCV